MGCSCGKQTKLKTRAPVAPAPEEQVPQTASSFQYIGTSGLTAYGRNRRVYRFGAPGMIVIVEAQDVAMLSHIPLLRRV